MSYNKFDDTSSYFEKVWQLQVGNPFNIAKILTRHPDFCVGRAKNTFGVIE